MPQSFDRELHRILRQAGCEYVRPAKGSHQVWFSPVTQRNFIVPYGILSRHMANVVLKAAGLPKGF